MNVIKHDDKTRGHFWLGLCLALSVVLASVSVTVVARTYAATNLISGMVTAPDGELPPPQTIVILVSPDGNEHGVAQVDDGDGTFSLGPIANGNYIVVAKVPGSSDLTPSLPVSVAMIGDPVAVGVVPLTTPAVTGSVFAPDGETLVTARVQVRRHGHLVQSDLAEDGALKLGGLLSGTYQIQALPATDEPFWQSVSQPLTIETGITQTLSLRLRPAQVAGVVTDPNGVPVQGALVHVLGESTLQHRRDVSSASGYFAIGDLAEDGYELTAEPPWYAEGLMQSEVISFTVPPSFTDVGQVWLRGAPKIVEGTAQTNVGQPVANALVVANRLDHPGHQEALTGDDGGYRLALSGGLWSLTVEPTPESNPDGWIFASPPLLVHFDDDLEAEHKVVNFELLTADATVMGVVTMPDGLAPSFAVTVHVRNNEGHGRATAVDEVDGSFMLNLPHGNYVLHIQAHDPGYFGPPPQPIFLPPNGTVDLGTQALLKKDATISGTVTSDDGTGVGGVTVAGWSREHLGTQTMTSPDGSYVLAVSGGSWQLTASVPPTMPYVYLGPAAAIDIESEENVTDIDFELTTADNVVQGQLVTPGGHPVSAQGWAQARSGDGAVNGAPVAGGHFQIFLPDGTYQVQVQLAPGSRWLPGSGQTVVLAGGETISVTMPVLPQNADIVGALWDRRNEVVPTGVKGYVMADNPFAWVQSAINPGNGTYHLGVSAGLWHLGYGVDPSSGYVVLDHHQVIPMEAGQTAVVPLPVAARDSVIAGIVRKPDGAPLPGAVVVADGVGGGIKQVTLRTHTDDNGMFSLRLPYGPYRLHAHHVEAPDNWLNPALHTVLVRPEQQLSGLELQFRVPDVTLSGNTVLATDDAGDGLVHIWAYSADGAATHTAVPLGQRYELGLLSNSTWHIGAALETANSFYALRTAVEMEGGDETLDLVLQGPFPKPGPVVVSFDSAQPQHLSLADGTEIFIPAGALPVEGRVTLHITPIATLPHQHHARLYKYGYAFIATDESGMPLSSSFNQNVVIRFQYDEAVLAELNLREHGLKPAYYSTSTQSWTIPESYVVDSANNLVTMQIDHFTDFSLLNGEASYEMMLPLVVR